MFTFSAQMSPDIKYAKLTETEILAHNYPAEPFKKIVFEIQTKLRLDIPAWLVVFINKALSNLRRGCH